MNHILTLKNKNKILTRQSMVRLFIKDISKVLPYLLSDIQQPRKC